MIDFLSANFKNPDKVEKLLWGKAVKFGTTSIYRVADKDTGYPIKGYLENLKITITKTSAKISGSLHKYSNVIEKGVPQNFDLFTHKAMLRARDRLLNELECDPCELELKQLENGFNLSCFKNVEQIIRSNILMYQFKHPNKQKGDQFQDQKQFQLSDHTLKCYNKGKEQKVFSCPSNTLRIEKKIKGSRALQKLGLYTLDDALKVENLKRLNTDFQKSLEKLQIVDSNLVMIGNDKIPNDILNGFGSNYWDSLPRNNRHRIKKRFIKFFEEQNLLNLKKQIIESAEIEFNRVINNESIYSTG